MIHVQHKVADVRRWFLDAKDRGEYVVDKTGCEMLEVVGATFIADEPTIFGEVNQLYVDRELTWYKSMSLNVNDIPGGAPVVWKACATPEGFINSNYGYMIWSKENHSQYDNVVKELQKSPFSRRAVMIYTRPSMWEDYKSGGKSDFVCTNATQHLIRDGRLVSIVQMRSNDLVYGYRNDFAFQSVVHSMLASDLNVPAGEIIWHAGSLHVYSRHFNLVK